MSHNTALYFGWISRQWYVGKANIVRNTSISENPGIVRRYREHCLGSCEKINTTAIFEGTGHGRSVRR